jgi:hypothetical protein
MKLAGKRPHFRGLLLGTRVYTVGGELLEEIRPGKFRHNRGVSLLSRNFNIIRHDVLLFN